ncbi:hypothetical protein H8356DRAFT_1332598 [Neocallimastix lanati (nom. inval.)]|nr:hypothetical protein H8356DRAFT_1332598 [Neocallimastix sp. JGI-2020a]
MFRYFSKVIDYEEKIEVLCENFDLLKEITENHKKNEKIRYCTNLKLNISSTIYYNYNIFYHKVDSFVHNYSPLLNNLSYQYFHSTSFADSTTFTLGRKLCA